MSADPVRDLSVASVTDALTSPEQVTELRGEQLVWQWLLHQASAQLSDLAGYPHSRPARTAPDVAAEHIRSAGKVLRDLDNVLDPKQCPAGHDLSARHLQQRVERGQRTLGQVS